MARRPSSVCPSVCNLFAQIASTTTQMARLRLAHDGLQVSVHPQCAQGQGHGHVTYMITQKSLLLPR